MTPPPDLIIVNARIATGNPRRPWATALAIRASTLAALGQAAEIQKMANATTKIVDAKGIELILPAGTAIGTALTVIVSQSGIQLTQPIQAPNG